MIKHIRSWNRLLEIHKVCVNHLVIFTQLQQTVPPLAATGVSIISQYLLRYNKLPRHWQQQWCQLSASYLLSYNRVSHHGQQQWSQLSASIYLAKIKLPAIGSNSGVNYWLVFTQLQYSVPQLAAIVVSINCYYLLSYTRVSHHGQQQWSQL